MPMRRWSGFSLVELLVVISILGVLAAIMFPVYTQARDKARRVGCITNQRQLAMSILMYANDWGGHLPNGASIWRRLDINGKALVCPAAGDTAPIGYVYNWVLGGKDIDAIEDPTLKFLTADGDGEAQGMSTLDDLARTRHNGFLMASFLDGHLESVNPTRATIFLPDPHFRGPLTLYCASAFFTALSGGTSGNEANGLAYKFYATLQWPTAPLYPASSTPVFPKTPDRSSQNLLNAIKANGGGDLYLPADESYLSDAYISESVALAYMHPVVIVNKAAAPTLTIHSLDELMGCGYDIALGNPDSASIAKLVKSQLSLSGRWDDFNAHVNGGGSGAGGKYYKEVSDVAQAVASGKAKVGIVWDATARGVNNGNKFNAAPTGPFLNSLNIFEVPSISSKKVKVKVGVLSTGEHQFAALQFAEFLAASNGGEPVLRAAKEQYETIPGGVWLP